MNRSLSSLAVAVLALWLVAGAGAEEFNVGTWKTAQTIQPFFYEKFMPSTDRVTVYPFTNPADQAVALLAGSLDMCGTTIAHAIHAASRGRPVAVVAALCNKCSALVVRKNSRVASVDDLKGRRIGYVPGTMHEILLRETLVRRGISPERDVQLIRVDFFDMGTALARGGIDAFLSGEPFPTLAVEQGYGRILAYPYYGESVGTINAGMLVDRRTIAENPRKVYRLVSAHVRATGYLNSRPEEWLQRAAAFGIPLDVLRLARPNMELAWELDGDFVARGRALGQRMQALGVIQGQPDYQRLFDLSFMERLREPY